MTHTQLHALTRRPNFGPFWSFHLLFCHTHVPTAAKLHCTEVNKKKSITDITFFPSHAQLFTFYLFVIKTLPDYCSWHIIYFLSGGFILSMWGQWEPERADLNLRFSQHTSGDLLHRLIPSGCGCAFPQAWGTVTHLSFTAAVTQQSHYEVCEVLSTSVHVLSAQVVFLHRNE